MDRQKQTLEWVNSLRKDESGNEYEHTYALFGAMQLDILVCRFHGGRRETHLAVRACNDRHDEVDVHSKYVVDEVPLDTAKAYLIAAVRSWLEVQTAALQRILE